MDQRRLVDLVKQIPQLWDRNCPTFRDKDAKDRGWEEVGRKMDQPGTYNLYFYLFHAEKKGHNCVCAR